jgi:hypothetical protein
MDKFLLVFKNKIKSLKKYEMSDDDWQSFINYKKLNSVPQNNKFNLNRKFRIGITVAASILAFSVFAFFIENHFDFFDAKFAATSKKMIDKDTFTSIDKSSIKNDSYLISKQNQNLSLDEVKSIDSKIISSEIKNNENYKVNSSTLIKKQNNIDSNQKSIYKNQKLDSPVNHCSISTSELVKSNSIKKPNTTETDLKNLNRESNNEINRSMESELAKVEITTLINSMIISSILPKLFPKNFKIKNTEPDIVTDTTIIYVLNPAKKIIRNPHFIVSGTFGYVKPLKDQFDRSELSAKNLSVEYYLLKKFRLGLNYGVSNDIAKIERKEKYPTLNDVNPHHPDAKLEELTMKTLHKKIGIEANFDILTYKKFLGSLGLGFKHDIFNNYNFRLKVREKDGMQYFEEQEQKIIVKNRNYIVPKLSLEYQLLENFRLKGLVEYEASVSDLSEKYLSMEAGIAFCF